MVGSVKTSRFSIHAKRTAPEKGLFTAVGYCSVSGSLLKRIYINTANMPPPKKGRRLWVQMILSHIFTAHRAPSYSPLSDADEGKEEEDEGVRFRDTKHLMSMMELRLLGTKSSFMVVYKAQKILSGYMLYCEIHLKTLKHQNIMNFYASFAMGLDLFLC